MSGAATHRRMPRLVEIRREGNDVSLKIDGEEFPYYLSAKGAVVAGISSHDAPLVVLEIPCDRIEAVNALGVQTPEVDE
jgi:hypothetical protein